MKKPWQKFIAGLLLGVIIFSTITSILFWPKPAKAQWLVGVVNDIVASLRWIWDQLRDALKIALQQFTAITYKQALTEFSRQLAFNAATWLATAGKEGNPLFFWDVDYWEKMGSQIAGEFLDDVSKNFLGFGLCEPLPEIKLRILLSLPVPKPKWAIPLFKPEERCSLSTIVANLGVLTKKFVIKARGAFDECRKFLETLKSQIEGGTFHSSFVKNELSELVKGEFEVLDLISKYISKVEEILEKKPQAGGAEERELKNLEKEIEGKLEVIRRKAENLNRFADDCLKLGPNQFCQGECVKFCEPPTAEYCQDQHSNLTLCLDNLRILLSSPLGMGWLLKFRDHHQNVESAYKNLKHAIYQHIHAKFTFALDKPEAKFQILTDFQKSVTPEQSILGQIAKLEAELNKRLRKIEDSKFMKFLQGEWDPVRSKISGQVLQPAQVTGKVAEKAIEGATKSEETFTGQLIADAMGVFLNTLFSKIFEEIKRGRFIGRQLFSPPEVGIIWEKEATWGELFKKASTTGGAPPGGGGPTESPSQPPKPEVVKAILADVLATPVKKGGIIRLIDEFSQCPSDPKYALPINCVTDIPFARAVDQELTIKEAMEKDLLHPQWYVSAPNSHLGGVDTKRDFSSRYSYTNIKILARAGIVPLGLQIAAEIISQGKYHPYNPSTGLFENKKKPLPDKERYTLKEIVDGFDDPNSPFYKLVNPNWVLKDSPRLCQMVGYSAVPLPNSPERQETCLEYRDCTGENDDGTCHTFNYCTAYRNSWRFNADRCEPQYESCKSYTRNRDGARFNWLEKTLDYNDCDANSVGCSWYCKNYDPKLGSSGMWSCTVPGKKYSQCNLTSKCNLSGGCPCPSSENKKCIVPYNSSYCLYEEEDQENVIFFNRQVESCNSSSEGCTNFIRTKANLGTNLLYNGSFEIYNEETKTSSGWRFSTSGNQVCGQFVLDETKAYSGKVYAKFSNTCENYFLSPEGLSLSLLSQTKYTLSFEAKNENLENNLNLTFAIAYTDISKTWTIPKNSGWQLYSFTFKTPLFNPPRIEQIYFEGKPDLALDNIQLERGVFNSSYKEYGSVNNIYLKKAPSWLNCYDDDLNNDSPDCINFVKKCESNEVDCEKYTPTVGGPYITAVAKENDYCPRECVGYEYFLQMPTNFYPEEDTYFIPKTARNCPASEVGCERFTNLEEVARGGEARQFYSFLRACQKPDGNCAYFYTWVGNESRGYELKRYYLRKNENNQPFEILDPEIAEKNWGKCQGPEDARTNPNCKEFYNENGEISYRLYPNTLVCKEGCIRLRKDQPISSSYCWPTLFENNDPINGRPKIDGLSFNLTGENEGICTFVADLNESIKCSEINEGCREYKGNNANVIKTIFFDDFEKGTVSPWQAVEDSKVSLSNESIYFGGHSLKLEPSLGSQNPPSSFLEKFISKAKAQLIGTASAQRPVYNLEKGKSYLISLLVKPGGRNQNLEVKFLPSNLSFSSISLTQKDWQLINLGPLYFDKEPDPQEKILISSNGVVYLDNIILKETGSLYLIKNSWFTPFSCDNELNDDYGKKCGGTLTNPKRCDPQKMVGCQEYKDRSNLSFYFKSFSSLCPDNKVGCEALINTFNSSSPLEEKFNNDKLPETDDLTVPADKIEYLVYDKDLSCQATDKGCQRFGKPNLVNGKATTYDEVFLKNNPDQYLSRSILCRQTQQNCEEFIVAGGGTVYFVDPLDKQCEFKEKTAERKAGWYKIGTDQPCYPEYLKNNIYEIHFSGEPGYLGYAGFCPDKAVGCKEFIDPLATAEGRNYLKNGDFKKNLESWNFNLEGCNNQVCTVEQTNEERSPSLLISVKDSQPLNGKARIIYSVYQNVLVKEEKSTSYLLTFEGKIENLKNLSWAGAFVQLFYQGRKSKEELNECSECEDWQHYKSNCSNGPRDCCGWFGGTWDGTKCNFPSTGFWSIKENRSCVFGRSPTMEYKDRGLGYPTDPRNSTFSRCIAWAIEAGFKPWEGDDGNGLNSWAWNYEHGYETGVGIKLDSDKKREREWQRVSLPIISGKDLNPKGYPLDSLVVHAILSPARWDSCDPSNSNSCTDPWPSQGQPPWQCCSPAGKVYFDNFELKPFTPYYLIDNYKLDKSSCNGQVSLENGCVLFKDPEIKENFFNSIATYQKSKDLKGALVSPVDCTKKPFPSPSQILPIPQTMNLFKKIFTFLFKKAEAQIIPIFSCQNENYKNTDYCKYCEKFGQTTNDTNLILKVYPTRVCAEWFHCQKTFKDWQKEINDYIEICQEGVRCNRQIGQGKEAECVSEVKVENEVLDELKYKNRDVSWSALEPGGWSLYNFRPLEKLKPEVKEFNGLKDQLFLTSKIEEREVGVSGDCSETPCPSGAICDAGKCIIPLSPQAYPEKDAPFRPEITKTFSQVNTCSLGDTADCETYSHSEAECKAKAYMGCIWSNIYNCYYEHCEYRNNNDACNQGVSYGCYWNSSSSRCECMPGANCEKVFCGEYDNNQSKCNEAYDHGCRWENEDNKCKCRGEKCLWQQGLEDGRLFNYFACQLSYIKAEYGSGGGVKKYFNIPSENNPKANVWPGICLRGAEWKLNKMCVIDSDCGPGEDVLCEKLTKITRYNSRPNFCLLLDASSPDFEITKNCLISWYPFASALAPDIETSKNPSVTARTATLKGKITNFGGSLSASVWFKWGSSCENLNNETPHLTLFPPAPIEFSHRIEGLDQNTGYCFKAVAQNASGFKEGDPVSFQTKPAPAFDFNLTADPNKGSVIPNGEDKILTTLTATVPDTNSEANEQTITFSYTNPYPRDGGININFPNGNSCTPPLRSGGRSCSVTAEISADPGTRNDRYTITFKGITNISRLERTVDFALTVGKGTCQDEDHRKSCDNDDDCTRNGRQFFCEVIRGHCICTNEPCDDNRDCSDTWTCGACMKHPSGKWTCESTSPCCSSEWCNERPDCQQSGSNDCVIDEGRCGPVPDSCTNDEDCPPDMWCEIRE